jgi:hypothetical protein
MNDVRCHVFTTVLCTSPAALPCKMISQGLLCDTIFADSTCFTLCPDSVRTTHLIRFLRVPIRLVSISIAVTLRCLLCDQKFTDSLRGKMPMDLPCNAVFKVCKRRRTGGAGGTTKAHLDSLLGRQTGNCGGEVRLVLAMHPLAAPVFGVASTSREQNSSPRSSTRILHVSVHKDTQQII